MSEDPIRIPRQKMMEDIAAEAALTTLKASSMVLWIIFGASIFVGFYIVNGGQQFVTDSLVGAGLGPYGILVLMNILLILLGMFLDSVSIILIMAPLVLPVAEGFGANLVWFGIVTVIVVEMGLLTPPMGLSGYVVKSTLNDDRVSLYDIFAGALPFVLIMLAVTVLLIAVPELCLFFT